MKNVSGKFMNIYINSQLFVIPDNKSFFEIYCFVNFVSFLYNRSALVHLYVFILKYVQYYFSVERPLLG
jgi:hypothetical protein